VNKFKLRQYQNGYQKTAVRGIATEQLTSAGCSTAIDWNGPLADWRVQVAIREKLTFVQLAAKPLAVALGA
jgi:hypothetical protein